MADLIATPGWDPIPQLETTTPALAGNGPMNFQAQALLNRTANLRIDLDTVIAKTTDIDNTSDANKPISDATATALNLKAPTDSPVFTGTVSGITKSMVGLGNVDNTSDAGKPISTATLNALNLKAPLDSPVFSGTVSGISKLMVGLGNVDNTADTAKPVSIPQQSAINLKANKSGDTFTGNITIQTTADSALLLNANSSSSYAYVSFRQGGVSRWELNTRATTGGATGDIVFDRHDDAGSWVSSPFRIQRSDGSIILNEGGGNTIVNGSLTIGSATSLSSNIYMNDLDHGQRIIHCNTNRIGFLNQSSGWGSWCNDDGSWQSDTLIGNTVVYANPANGYQFVGNAHDGSGGYFCTIAYGAPNYGAFAERFWHQSGSYVGWQVTSSDGKTLRWSGQTGTLNADAFTPWSDRRLKTDLTVIDDARSKVAALTGYEFTMLNSRNYDGTQKRRAGLIAQDVLEVLPVSVELCHAEEGTHGPAEIDPNDETEGKRYSLDYNGVIALLVNDNNALAARIAALEAQVAALS